MRDLDEHLAGGGRVTRAENGVHKPVQAMRDGADSLQQRIRAWCADEVAKDVDLEMVAVEQQEESAKKNWKISILLCSSLIWL